jgi:hypothetical protein
MIRITFRRLWIIKILIYSENQQVESDSFRCWILPGYHSSDGLAGCCDTRLVRAFLVTRHRLALEAAALRQQLTVFKRKQPRLPLKQQDRLFWTMLRRLYSGWADTLIIVKPETVVSWHRAGFRLFWRRGSQEVGRPKVTCEIRELIRRMNADNPSWGAPTPESGP